MGGDHVCFILLACIALTSALPLSHKPATSFLQTATETQQTSLQACPEGDTCCKDKNTLERCVYKNGLCCGDLGFCCPQGSRCSHTQGSGQPNCVKQESRQSESTNKDDSADDDEEGEEKEEEESTNMNSDAEDKKLENEAEKNYQQHEKHSRLKRRGIVLANANKITSVHRVRRFRHSAKSGPGRKRSVVDKLADVFKKGGAKASGSPQQEKDAVLMSGDGEHDQTP